MNYPCKSVPHRTSASSVDPWLTFLPMRRRPVHRNGLLRCWHFLRIAVLRPTIVPDAWVVRMQRENELNFFCTHF